MVNPIPLLKTCCHPDGKYIMNRFNMSIAFMHEKLTNGGSCGCCGLAPSGLFDAGFQHPV